MGKVLVLDEIIYQFANVNGVWEWISDFILYFSGIVYPW